MIKINFKYLVLGVLLHYCIGNSISSNIKLKKIIIIDTLNTTLNMYLFQEKKCNDSVNIGRLYFVTDSVINITNKLKESVIINNSCGIFVCYTDQKGLFKNLFRIVDINSDSILVDTSYKLARSQVSNFRVKGKFIRVLVSNSYLLEFLYKSNFCNYKKYQLELKKSNLMNSYSLFYIYYK